MEALQSINFQSIHQYAIEYITNNMTSIIQVHEDEAILRGLLRWFKHDFFKWCNKPDCSNVNCSFKATKMEGIGGRAPTDYERTIGWGGRVEVDIIEIY
jgi:hypothetical protein